MANNAKLPDFTVAQAAGLFDPKTGLPRKFGETLPDFKGAIKKYLRVIDEQDAVNRYVWTNLPDITSQELERLLYYKGQLCIFYNEDLDKFFYLPFALEGTIDLYNRYQTIHPVPIGTTEAKDEKLRNKALAEWLSTLSLEVAHDIVLPEDLTYNHLTNSTAILYDYTPQLSPTILSRQVLQDGIIDLEADCLPLMRTALLNATGIRAIRVNNENEAPNIYAASAAINQAALSGQKYLPIVGSVDFQDLTDGSIGKSEEFLLAMQSIDNIRLMGLGLQSGGIFEKKAHLLQSEAQMGQGDVSLILNDGLLRRQHFCNIVNSIWGLGIWCEAAEGATGADKNLDGEVSTELDGQDSYDNQPMNGGQEQ